RVQAKCVKGYPWYIYASMERNDQSFKVKTYHSEHKCSHKFKNKRVTARFIAAEFKDRIITSPKCKLLEIKEWCNKEFKVNVGISKCMRAKGIVIKEMEGNHKEQFAMLRDYGEELLRTNPGSTVRIKTERIGGKDWPLLFKRMYVCFDACKKGWLAGCRPIIGMDGCFLKGLCKGELLTAIGRDGNNQMFPIAWVVVEVECTDSW
ncbi:hypothetical protein CFOL_v3_21846, partial [Cephalotus follicularis]